MRSEFGLRKFLANRAWYVCDLSIREVLSNHY
jgi:hypothetical protein